MRASFLIIFMCLFFANKIYGAQIWPHLTRSWTLYNYPFQRSQLLGAVGNHFGNIFGETGINRHSGFWKGGGGRK